MATFPSVTGTANIRASAPAFVAAFKRRVEARLFPHGSPRRSRYEITQASPDRLAFRAVNFLSAFNVGLNDVELTVPAPGRVSFKIRYARWAAYAVGFGALLGLVFVVVFTWIDLRTYIATHSLSRLPGLSLNQNVLLAWTFVFFWSLVWPWILIALHRRPLRRLMGHLIAEVDAAATSPQ